MKNTKKFLSALLLVCMIVSMLPVGAFASEPCAHVFSAATCTAPATCTACGVPDGAALGHIGGMATCTAPAVCERCGQPYVAALGHIGGTATCTATAVCERCTQPYVEALGHNYSAVVTAPTCTVGGYTTYTCSVCGGSYMADEVPALGHTPGEAVTVPASCEADGSITVPCTVCGGTASSSAIPAAHTPGEAVTVPATCTADGSIAVPCTACGETISSETIPAGHNHAAVVTAPTCTEAGYTTYTCACGDSYVENGDAATGHTADGEGLVTAATCTVGGYTTYTCSVCKGTYDAEFTAPLGHTPVEGSAVVTEPTCTEAGYTTYTCACGDSYVADEVSATGHSYDAVVTQPTCTEAGYTTYTCACGDSYEADEVPALGHNYVKHVCDRCGENEPLLTSSGDGASEGCEHSEHYLDGTCKSCDVVVGHNWGEGTACSCGAQIQIASFGGAVMKEGETRPFNLSQQNLTGEVEWFSSDNTVASFTGNILTAHKAGDTVVTAKYNGQLLSNSVPVEVVDEYNPITAVTIDSQGVNEVYTGKTLQLNGSFTTENPDKAPTDMYLWNSNNPDVAEVNPTSGLVTAIAPGEATISLIVIPTSPNADNNNPVTATLTLTVKPVLVTGIDLGADITCDFEPNKTLTITPTITPDDATDNTLDWTSSAPGIATVDANGVVTIKGVGETTITATAKDGSGVTDSLKVTVKQPILVQSIELSGPAVINTDDQTNYFSVTVKPGNATNQDVSWSSSDETVATVAPVGKYASVTGHKAGYTVITATAADGSEVSASMIVNVVDTSGVHIEANSSKVLVGKTIEVWLTNPAGAAFTSVTWEVSDSTKATITPKAEDPSHAIVTGVSAGLVTVSVGYEATGNDGNTRNGYIGNGYAIEVEAVPVTKITISGGDTVTAGSTITLTADVEPDNATNDGVTWSVDKTSIATIDQNGKLTGVSAGKVKVTATANDNDEITATHEVTVTAAEPAAVPVSKITISGKDTVVVGSTITLTATAEPTNATDKTVKWSVNNTKIATIDAKGVLKGIAAGEVTVTATANDGSGKSATHKVKVAAAPVPYLYYGHGTHFNGIHPIPFVSSEHWYYGQDGVQVVIDGIPLIPGRHYSYYSSPSGMTGVTVYPGFLRFLPENSWHLIEIISANGEASGYFSTGYYGSYSIHGVKTGDDNAPGLWALLCLLGLSGAGLILVKSRKRKA